MRLTCLFFVTLTALTGCTSSRVQQGGQHGAISSASGIFLAPYFNATPNPNAGRAMTEITSTSLMAYGLPLIQSEDGLRQGQAMLEAEGGGNSIDMARTLRASHALVGTVHEYRYKSDMDGSPVVGITMRLVETAGGETVWQGSSTRSSGYFGSLTRTAQGAVDNLMEQMLGRAAPERPAGSSSQSKWAQSAPAPAAVSANGQPNWAQPGQIPGPIPTTTVAIPNLPPTNPYEQIARRGVPSATIPTTTIPVVTTVPPTTFANPYATSYTPPVIPAPQPYSNPYPPPVIPTPQGGGLVPRTVTNYGTTITAPVFSYPVTPPVTGSTPTLPMPPPPPSSSGGTLTPRF